MAKIYFDLQELLQYSMLGEEDIIVSRYGLYLGKSLFDSHKRPVDFCYRDRKNLLNKRSSDFAVYYDEQNAVPASAGDDEVSLCMADTLPFIDRCWSFLNPDAIRKLSLFGVSLPAARSFFMPIDLNPSAIGTLYEAIDGIF